MAKKRWQDLSPRTRQVIAVAATVDAALKVAALLDLKRRPAAQVRGSKRAWTALVLLVNSGGVVPVTYFLRGRRRRS